MIEIRYLRIADVEHITGIGKSAIYRLIKEGTFPEPVRLLPKTSRWKSDDIQEWIKQTSKQASMLGSGQLRPRSTEASSDAP